MTDPHPNRGPDGVTVRRPGLAHIICTVRPAHACVLQLLVLHTFDSRPPSLRECFARRHTPDVVVELGFN